MAVWVVLGLLLAGVIVAKRYVSFFVIPQNGMYPTLPSGSRLLARKHAYRSLADVRRGDIVLIEQADLERKYILIWRVIGVPGDTIAVSTTNVVVNGLPLKHEEIRREQDFVIYREQNSDSTYEVAYQASPEFDPRPVAERRLGPSEFFVLGDNRYNARDSTYTGPVAFSAIVGKKL